MGPDPITAGTWVELDPSNPRAWSALAAAGGTDACDAEQARFVATLLDPWPEASKLPTKGGFVRERRALAESLAHLLADERWRQLGDAEASPPQPTAARSEQVIWTGPFHPSNVSLIEERVATVVGFPAPPGRLTSASRWSQKLSAPPGSLPTWVHTSPGICVRAAFFERADPIIQSRAFITCETNCEDRLTSFGFVWLGPTRHVAWRSSMSLVAGVPARSPVLLDVFDRGDGSWGDATAKLLRDGPAKGFVSGA